MSPSLAMLLWMGAVSAILRAGGGGGAHIGSILMCFIAATFEAGLLESERPRDGISRRVVQTICCILFAAAICLDMLVFCAGVASRL